MNSLFKYTCCDTVKIILVNQSLRFSHPSFFNDPFDSNIEHFLKEELFKINMTKNREKALELIFMDENELPAHLKEYPAMVMIRNKIRELSKQHCELIKNEALSEDIGNLPNLESIKENQKENLKIIYEVMNRHVLLSLSSTFKSGSMWYHYANQHKGVMMEFLPSSDDSYFHTVQKVKYENTLLHPSDGSLIGLSDMDKAKKLNDSVLLTKSTDWQYEHEFRVVIPEELSKGELHKSYQFIKEDLVSLTFGLCTTLEEEKEIINVLRLFDFNIKIFKAQKSLFNREIDRVPYKL